MTAKAEQTGSVLSASRVASLSDTMFGVAMTLVPTTLLPSIQAHRGSVLDMLPDMRDALVTVALSFAIAARYWMTQQQRLALTPFVTPLQAWLHLLFLFLIVLVPISTSLDGLTGSGAQLGPVMIYGAHFFMIALVNLLLWIEVHRATAVRLQIARSSLALGLFAVALPVGALRPSLAQYVWFSVFAAPLLARYPLRRFFGD